MGLHALAAHDLVGLDKRHLGLLTVIVVVWFASAWVGDRARRGSPWREIAVTACAVIVLVAFIVDPWVGLASLQVPLFALKGYRSGSFV